MRRSSFEIVRRPARRECRRDDRAWACRHGTNGSGGAGPVLRGPRSRNPCFQGMFAMKPWLAAEWEICGKYVTAQVGRAVTPREALPSAISVARRHAQGVQRGCGAPRFGQDRRSQGTGLAAKPPGLLHYAAAERAMGARMDSTVKTLYGHQEGAEVGYNPHKPGRPSHAYHTYMLSEFEINPQRRHARRFCAMLVTGSRSTSRPSMPLGSIRSRFGSPSWFASLSAVATSPPKSVSGRGSRASSPTSMLPWPNFPTRRKNMT